MTNIALTSEDRAVAQISDRETDLPPSAGLHSSLLQNMSQALSPHEPSFLPGASAGDFCLLYSNGERVLVKGGLGFACSIVAFSRCFNEWLPDRGGFVASYEERPEGADWNVTADGRKALLMPNGNRLEEVVSSCLLVEGRGVIFDWKSSALRAGWNFHDHASNVRAVVDGCEVWGFGVSKWRITSRLERGPRGTWFTPVATMLGRLGEPEGPTVAEWRLADKARQALKSGVDWAEPVALPALASTEEPRTSRRRRVTIESGRSPAAPAEDSEIPFLGR
jgi:hypothetical protein